MDETLRLLQRIKNTADGKDFINYLQELSASNYNSWKHEGGDVLRGKAIAIDGLISLFESVDVKCRQVSPQLNKIF